MRILHAKKKLASPSRNLRLLVKWAIQIGIPATPVPWSLHTFASYKSNGYLPLAAKCWSQYTSDRKTMR